MGWNISRRTFLQTSGAALGVGVSALETVPVSADDMLSTQRPNLVFVFPDEFRRQAVGCMGEDPVLTPHLDRFAAESMVLTQAVSNRPVCSPYRASMLTGKYPFSNGVTTNCYSGSLPYNVYLREDERCISDVLHDAGYHCGYIGKWHLEAPQQPWLFDRGQGGVWDECTPPGPRRHGFDFWHSYGCHDSHMHPHYWIGDAPRDGYTVFDTWSPRHEAETAMAYIRNEGGTQREAGRPFALFVSMNPPHMPFDQVPSEYVERYGNATPVSLLTRPNVNLDTEAAQGAKKWAKHYFAAVTGVDEQFGRILQCLKETGLDKNTIVVFTSDHGEMMGSHGRMYKGVWYEESFGVPFLIRWPGHIRPGRESMLFGAPDVMPTLLGMMGLDASIPAQVEGENLSNVFCGYGSSRPESTVFLNHNPAEPEAGARGVRTPDAMFVVERGGSGEQRYLYDMAKDPHQIKNLAGEKPAFEKDLAAQLNRWLDRTGDPWHRVSA